MLKVNVCAKCGLIALATDMATKEPVCPVCLCRKFREAELPEELTCTYCERTKRTEDILKIWKAPPFFNASDGTYYDGCRGWN